MRSAGQLLFAPYRRLAKRACSGADALTGVSQQYLDWALLQAGRKAGPRDRVTPLGFEALPAEPAQSNECVAELRRRGVDVRRPVCFFAGLFEHSYDLETVMHAARRLHQGGTGVQFVLCGDGSKMPVVHRLAAGLPNVHTLGWVDPFMLQAAASVAAIGLCAYSPRATQSLPNKPFEYMAGRLAIVSSLSGELAELLDRHECGVTYCAGDASSLVDCLVRLLRNPARLQAMRANAYRTWSERYQTGHIYPQFAARLEAMAAVTARAA